MALHDPCTTPARSLQAPCNGRAAPLRRPRRNGASPCGERFGRHAACKAPARPLDLGNATGSPLGCFRNLRRVSSPQTAEGEPIAAGSPELPTLRPGQGPAGWIDCAPAVQRWRSTRSIVRPPWRKTPLAQDLQPGGACARRHGAGAAALHRPAPPGLRRSPPGTYLPGPVQDLERIGAGVRCNR